MVYFLLENSLDILLFVFYNYLMYDKVTYFQFEAVLTKNLKITLT